MEARWWLLGCGGSYTMDSERCVTGTRTATEISATSENRNGSTSDCSWWRRPTAGSKKQRGCGLQSGCSCLPIWRSSSSVAAWWSADRTVTITLTRRIALRFHRKDFIYSTTSNYFDWVTQFTKFHGFRDGNVGAIWFFNSDADRLERVGQMPPLNPPITTFDTASGWPRNAVFPMWTKRNVTQFGTAPVARDSQAENTLASGCVLPNWVYCCLCGRIETRFIMTRMCVRVFVYCALERGWWKWSERSHTLFAQTRITPVCANREFIRV